MPNVHLQRAISLHNQRFSARVHDELWYTVPKVQGNVVTRATLVLAVVEDQTIAV